MHKKLDLFTADNIISALGIKLNPHLNVHLDPCTDSHDVSSILRIDKPNRLRYCLITENFESVDNPNFRASFDIILTQKGFVKPYLNIQNPKISDLMLWMNQYIKMYMIMSDTEEFLDPVKIDFEIFVECKKDNGIILDKISCVSFLLIYLPKKNVSEKYICIRTVVDNYLKKAGLSVIDDSTSMDHKFNLVTMQRTIENMELI